MGCAHYLAPELRQDPAAGLRAEHLNRRASGQGDHAMTVYVDRMQAPFKGMLMCHMIADSEQELHAMAAAIGMQRKSYQGDHYDVPMHMKELAIRMGAREIGMRQLAAMVFLWRAGQPMGDPETAVLRMRAWKRQNVTIQRR
jgi:hypothetical protein